MSPLRTRLPFGHIVPRPLPPGQPRTATATPQGTTLCQHHQAMDPRGRQARRVPSRPKHFPLGRLQDQLRTCRKYSLLFPNTPAAPPPAALHDLRGGVGRVLGQLSEGVGGSSVILPANTGHWRVRSHCAGQRWPKFECACAVSPVHDVNKGTCDGSFAFLSALLSPSLLLCVTASSRSSFLVI